jgi:photosystem II stability/assembly factor-like uncharacterized protein
MKKIPFLICTITCFLIYSSSANAQWERVYGIAGGNISCLADSGSTVIAGTYQGGIILSTDNGNSWADIDNGLGVDTFILSLAISGSNIFAGASGNGVYLSRNDGSSWSSVNNGLTGYGISSLAVKDSNIFAGTQANGIYLSSINGSSWTAIDSGLTNPVISNIAISDTNIIAGTFGGGVFLSSDNGQSWKAVNNGLTDSEIYSLAISGSNIFVGTDSGVFLSTNNGAVWTEVDSGLPKISVFSLAASGSNVFAGTNEHGIFLSTDNGSGWTAIDSGLTGYTVCLITSLAINDSYIFAGTQSTENGIWRRSLSEVLGVESINANNSDFNIYPNPTTTQLNIQFSSVKNEAVTVSIMNVLGQETSPPTPLQRRGERAMIDVSKLPAGIYLLQLKTERGSATKTFVKE